VSRRVRVSCYSHSMRLSGHGGHEREPKRVAVAGERPGTLADLGDDPEEDAVAVAALAHAARRPGHSPDRRPRTQPDVAVMLSPGP
jgi:hypothetical protein